MGSPAPTHGTTSGPHASHGSAVLAVAADQALARYPTFEHVVELIRANRDVKLLVEVEGCVKLAAYQPGRIEFTPTNNAPSDLASRLGGALQRWTGNRWGVTVVNGSEALTIAETRDAADLALKAEAAKHPLVRAVFDAFPGARIEEIRTPDMIAAEAQADALPEVEDEWDPFEED
jgi:DNA polymerase-3 subunit gamma/tau